MRAKRARRTLLSVTPWANEEGQSRGGEFNDASTPHPYRRDSREVVSGPSSVNYGYGTLFGVSTRYIAHC